jgi:ribokinase
MVGTANGLNITDAIYYANICAGLKTTKVGAQTGMPKLDEVKQYIKEHNINLEINF